MKVYSSLHVRNLKKISPISERGYCSSQGPHTLCGRKIDLGTVDLAVQEEGVCSQSTRGKEEEHGAKGRTTSKRRSLNVSGGLLQLWENFVDVFASTSIGVEVLRWAEVLLALCGHFIGLFAQFIDLIILLIVVVIVVVLVGIISLVLLFLFARDALVLVDD